MSTQRGMISMKATLVIFAALIIGAVVVSAIAIVLTPKQASTNDEANARMRAVAKRQAEQPPPPAAVDGDSHETISRAKRLVEGLEKTRVIARWTCIGNEAYVDEPRWAAANIDEKQVTAFSLAVVCESQNSGRYITIKSYTTGKALATFNHRGFSVE